MAHPLSFKFLVHADSHDHVAKNLVKAFGGKDTHPLPPTVHYLWLVALPDEVGQPAGTKTMLLTTVYDGPFAPYVQDIAKEHPDLFDQALSKIIGMEKMVPVLQHLNDFTAFIEDHDLTGGGTTPTFLQNYNDTVLEIWSNE